MYKPVGARCRAFQHPAKRTTESASLARSLKGLAAGPFFPGPYISSRNLRRVSAARSWTGRQSMAESCSERRESTHFTAPRDACALSERAGSYSARFGLLFLIYTGADSYSSPSEKWRQTLIQEKYKLRRSLALLRSRLRHASISY